VNQTDFLFEPAKLEVWRTRIVSGLLLRRYYRDYVNKLDIQPTDRILDYCSGSGLITLWLARKTVQGEVVFADVSQTWLNVVRGRLYSYPQAKGLHINQLERVLDPVPFDKAVIHFALHDFAHHHRVLVIQQIKQNLKPGGFLYIREPLTPKHGMKLSEIVRLLTDAGCFIFNYKIGKNTLDGRYADFRCELKTSFAYDDTHSTNQ